MPDTATDYQRVIAHCRQLFKQKAKDYGTAWRILRLPSLTDQIYIKAARIRSIQEKGRHLVEDGIEEEFVGIINYCLMALIQDRLRDDTRLELSPEEAMQHYDDCLRVVQELLLRKNHDYGEAWRQMRVSSMTDIILMKLIRIKQIEDNAGQTLVSEGVISGYQDILNYAVFCLILMEFS
ncbi:MAG: DUF1599 domain-containing protein [Bernardetiaceae bacterium]